MSVHYGLHLVKVLKDTETGVLMMVCVVFLFKVLCLEGVDLAGIHTFGVIIASGRG